MSAVPPCRHYLQSQQISGAVLTGRRSVRAQIQPAEINARTRPITTPNTRAEFLCARTCAHCEDMDHSTVTCHCVRAVMTLHLQSWHFCQFEKSQVERGPGANTFFVCKIIQFGSLRWGWGSPPTRSGSPRLSPTRPHCDALITDANEARINYVTSPTWRHNSAGRDAWESPELISKSN